MISLTPKQRENISKAMFDISKLILAILVLGNIIGEKSFNLPIFIGGVITFIGFFIIAAIIDK